LPALTPGKSPQSGAKSQPLSPVPSLSDQIVIPAATPKQP